MGKTYSVEPYGAKFATVCRTDGFQSITFLSKNKKAARKKGDEFISGVRTARRKFVTPYGEMLNTIKSQQPRRKASLAMAVAFSTPE